MERETALLRQRPREAVNLIEQVGQGEFGCAGTELSIQCAAQTQALGFRGQESSSSPYVCPRLGAFIPNNHLPGPVSIVFSRSICSGFAHIKLPDFTV